MTLVSATQRFIGPARLYDAYAYGKLYHRTMPEDIHHPAKRNHMLPLFSGLTLPLAFTVHLAALAAWWGLRPTWLYVSVFLRVVKPGSQF